MNKPLITLLTVSTLMLSLSACMDMKNAMDMPDGKSEKMSSSTDANGTTTQRQYSTETDTDETGHKKTIVKSKVTKDPKGLFNKTTTTQTRDESK